MSSCNKEQNKPLYDNSKSFVTWAISPLPSATPGEAVLSPPLTAGWIFGQQYNASRMSANALTSPFYGYPTGAFLPNGTLSFDYSNDNNASQKVAIFFNSASTLNGLGTYQVASSFCNGYMAKVATTCMGKDLYFTGNKQIIIIDGYHAGCRMCDNTNVTVLTGRLQLYVTDSVGGSNVYSIAGNFQFPVTNPN